MKRLTPVVLAIALTISVAGPANADVNGNTGTIGSSYTYTSNPWSVPYKMYGYYSPKWYPYPSTLPICITSTWAASYYHKPKTRVGHYCIATKRTWLPLSYGIWGYLYRHGTPVLLVQRLW